MSRRKPRNETHLSADSTRGSAALSNIPPQHNATTAPLAEAQTASSWTVYMLRCADYSLYTGITNAPQKRLDQHLKGKASRYTRARLPVVFVYQEHVDTRGDALRREAALKRLTRQQKLKLIESSALSSNGQRSRAPSPRRRTVKPVALSANSKEAKP